MGYIIIRGAGWGGFILGGGIRVCGGLKIEDAGFTSKRFRVLRRRVSAV